MNADTQTTPEARHMEILSGRDIVGTVTFLLKHGVWFWTAHTGRELSDIQYWGDTFPAIERMVRRRGWTFRWK